MTARTAVDRMTARESKESAGRRRGALAVEPAGPGATRSYFNALRSAPKLMW